MILENQETDSVRSVLMDSILKMDFVKNVNQIVFNVLELVNVSNVQIITF